MKQDLGETVSALMRDDERDIEQILNKNPRGRYWILIHHKPTHEVTTEGQKVIRSVIKKYEARPPPLLGTVIMEVKDGEIVDTDVNFHDAPIDFQTLGDLGAVETNPIVQKRKANTSAYLYNK